MCKQNDKTKSVPGDVNLTLKLHKHRHLTLHLSADPLSVLGGGRKGKVTVHSKDVGSRNIVYYTLQSHGEEKASINA
jgi:hypothetical protein